MKATCFTLALSASFTGALASCRLVFPSSASSNAVSLVPTSSTTTSSSSSPTVTIYNADFEAIPTTVAPWTMSTQGGSATASVVTDQVYSGSYALKLSVSGSSGSAFSMQQSLDASQFTPGTYTFSGYARIDSTLTTTTGCRSLYLYCDGGDTDTDVSFWEYQLNSINQWTPIAVKCTYTAERLAFVPVGISLAAYNCRTANIWWDQIEITRNE